MNQPLLIPAALIAALIAAPLAADTVVAGRTIRSKSVVSATDLVLVAGTIPGTFTTIAEVAGLEARAILYPGQPVRRRDVGPPAVVERNDIVTLIYRAGALSISTEGRALARGGLGDRMRVMNLDSRTTISGVVTGPGLITVQP
ncbi:MAG: flagellar basal body P-ring formation protein FlgA [Rhodobacteraceae bacterium]|nr:flagellar basal body P-ring formation protein FlgA [Paracoccaceae bacterium]